MTSRMAVSFSRVYQDAAMRLPQRMLNFAELDLRFGNAVDYAAKRRLGAGRFGEVFEGVHIPSNRRVVLKVLKPIANLSKIKREVAILKTITDVPNSSTLVDVARDEASGTTVFVFPYMDNIPITKLFEAVTLPDARTYLWRLLHTLDTVHSMGIMHRDVKVNNILLDPKTRDTCLIDWGLADIYMPGTPKSTAIATRVFKAPELVLGMRYYDYAVDLWAVGCIAASFFFIRYPFFSKDGDSSKKVDPLIRHAGVLGTDALDAYMSKFGLRFTEEQLRGIRKKRSKIPWDAFIDDVNETMCSDAGFDLLDGLLQYDHTTRLTAKEAIAHPFFDDIRTGKQRG